MGEINFQKEVREAMAAGREALDRLDRVERTLNSAGNWGIWDMLGGGLISTVIKHSKIGDAEGEMEQARLALKRLQKELADVNSIAEFHIEIGDFLTFADYFFDGILADYLVQTKIRDAQRQVQDAQRRVRDILDKLNRV